jgi:hypothetical protein
MDECCNRGISTTLDEFDMVATFWQLRNVHQNNSEQSPTSTYSANEAPKANDDTPPPNMREAVTAWAV